MNASLLIAASLLSAADDGTAVLSERSIAELPVAGLSQSFAGLSGDTLIIAGGRHLDGDGAVAASRAIYVLPLPDGKWERAAIALPRKVWGGVAVSYQDQLICVGGTDGSRNYDAVFGLKYVDGRLTTISLPTLPSPRALHCGAVVDHVLYVAGGVERPDEAEPQPAFWALDLSNRAQHNEWQVLEPWPGSGRIEAVAAVQDSSFFLIGGRVSPDETAALRSTLRFTGRPGQLHGIWRPTADLPHGVSSALSIPLGQSHIAVVGGRRPGDSPEVSESAAEAESPDVTVLAYHTVTDTWATRGTTVSRWGAGAVHWQDGTLLVGGRTTDQQFARQVVMLQPLTPQSRFGWIGWSIVIAYFGMLLAMGWYFSRRERSTEEFFYAGRRVPWWAAGLSMFGTQLSAITFIAIPGVAYATDWVRMTNSLVYSAVMPVAIFIFVPFYCRLRVATAYEYLERRYNVAVRMLGSAVFIVYQLLRVGVVVYLPSIALAAVTGADIVVCVVAMALVSIIYTVMGGIEAVIWTDVLQVFVLLGGALLSVGMMIYLVGGFGQMVSVSAAAGKFHIVNWGWDPSDLVLWVMIVGPMFLNMGPFVTDQTVVQRYLTTTDEKQAARGVWANLVINIPASLLFFGTGAALFAYYKTFPEQLAIGKNDEAYPWFIVQQLPPVASGLVIAGVFAASMSSLDSSMNSVATAIVSDYYRRFRPAASDSRCLRLARWITLATGVFGGGIAVLLAHTEIGAIWDALRGMFGFTGGALLGVFLLAALTRRANSAGALIGLPAGFGAAALAATRTELNFMLYGAVGAIVCMVTGYLTSLLIPSAQRDLTGLTIWTMRSPVSLPP